MTKKVNVSINPETMKVLTDMKIKLSQDLGFMPSYSQVIQMLLKINEVAEQTVTNEGDANE